MAITVSDRAVEPAQRPAARFFWCWLLAATAMSVCGNVAHALLMDPIGIGGWLPSRRWCRRSC